MKEFIEYIIKQLVDKPDEVLVHKIAGERTVVFELHVGEGDMGKVIGRHGQIAAALRTLLIAAAAKEGKRIILEILDSNPMGQKNEKFQSPAVETADRKPVFEIQSKDERLN